MLEPTTFPMEMSARPLKAPVRLTTSSGHEVPNPTMVSPITNSLIPALRAMPEAPSTSQSAPNTVGDHDYGAAGHCGGGDHRVQGEAQYPGQHAAGHGDGYYVV